jgi:hypothetical protein
VDGHGQKRLSGLPKREGFLNSPSVMPPDTMDSMCNFSTVSDPNGCHVCLSLSPNFQIIGRLEEGEHAIVLDLIIKSAESGRRYCCATLIDSGASGLFINCVYATCLDAQLH